MVAPNPFKPTAGAEPPVLIGRDRAIEDFRDAIDEGVGARARLMRITGPRGSGKTVLLTELGDIARAKGWSVVDVTAGEGLTGRIIRALEREKKTALSLDAGVGPIKVHADFPGEGGDGSLRDALTRASSAATKRGSGLLVTIDEVQDAEEAEMREIAASIQHLIRERQNIALIFAGITTGVMDLLNGKALTFLRRAKSEDLGPLRLDEVSIALRHTIEQAEMTVDGRALELMTVQTAGYAYLIQLVGFHVWNAARRREGAEGHIEERDARVGIALAMEDFGETVQETALNDLPLRSMEYLLAMVEDDGVSATAEIARRMGAAASSLTSYRRMLIQRQVIEPTARGFVKFSIPYMREYLQNNADALLARYGVS